jgi:hypothetical protein
VYRDWSLNRSTLRRATSSVKPIVGDGVANAATALDDIGDDATALAQRLQEIIDDPSRADGYRTAARQRITSEYDWIGSPANGSRSISGSGVPP